jgi:hypothetical protein
MHSTIRRLSRRFGVTRLLLCLLAVAALAPAAAAQSVQGGSINGAVVVGDTVYVNSGYSAFGPGTSPRATSCSPSLSTAIKSTSVRPGDELRAAR